MKEEIQSWAEKPDYDIGVMLYRKYGNDPALLSLFALPETSFTFSRLKSALSDLIKEAPQEKQNTPPSVLALIRKRSQLHESLFHTHGKEDRHLISRTIQAIGKKLDRYYDDGKLPEDQAENQNKANTLPDNAWDLHMIINNNTAYLAKNKKREDKQGEIQRRIRQSENIEQRLKEMNYGAVS